MTTIGVVYQAIREEWTNLSGVQANIAKVIAAEMTGDQNSATLPPSYTGFHRSCYSYYTHKGKLEKAKKAHQKKQQPKPEAGKLLVLIMNSVISRFLIFSNHDNDL